MCQARICHTKFHKFFRFRPVKKFVFNNMLTTNNQTSIPNTCITLKEEPQKEEPQSPIKCGIRWHWGVCGHGFFQLPINQEWQFSQRFSFMNCLHVPIKHKIMSLNTINSKILTAKHTSCLPQIRMTKGNNSGEKSAGHSTVNVTFNT